MILPKINSPTDVKNSLLQIAKAKIYGVDINNFPTLQEHKERYDEYVKKKRKDKSVSRRHLENHKSLEIQNTVPTEVVEDPQSEKADTPLPEIS